MVVEVMVVEVMVVKVGFSSSSPLVMVKRLPGVIFVDCRSREIRGYL